MKKQSTFEKVCAIIAPVLITADVWFVVTFTQLDHFWPFLATLLIFWLVASLSFFLYLVGRGKTV